MSEHNEIDELLIDHKFLKKAKRKTWIRNIIISIVSFFVLSIAVIYTNAKLLNEISYETLWEEQLLYQIARPNTYITHSQLNDGFLRGELEYNTYKLLGNKPVYSGTYKKDYSLLPLTNGIYGTHNSTLIQINTEPNEESFHFYNKVGQKTMMFYHPDINYGEVATDLMTLEQYRDDARFEVALSFKKGFHFDEINQLLPHEIHSSWYWVDTFSKEGLRDLLEAEPIYDQDGNDTGDFIAHVLTANQVVGFDGINANGNNINIEEMDDAGKIKSLQDLFIKNIQIGLNQKGKYLSTYKTAYETLKDENGNMTPDNISIIGVVVTGDKKAMEALLDLPFVRASSFGVILD
ncbi:MAG TPA: hypothetical protein GX525_09525 [Bacilli bacterium]|nr:hypothetical protein [Bacilli bacterium]